VNRESFKWKIKKMIGGNLFLYKNIYSRLARRKHILVNQNSDLVVEGYPRSGNTFAVALLKVLSPGLKIARHRHEVGHVKMALTFEKPVVLLIRNPLDSVISFYIREGVDLKTGFDYYYHFYSSLLPYREKLLVVDFKKLIKEPSRFIEDINRRFGFSLPIPGPQEVESAKALVKEMDSEELLRKTELSKKDPTLISSVPTKEKELLKERLRREILGDRRLSSLLEACKRVYQEIIFQ